MKATNKQFKTSVLSAAVSLALGLGANISQAAVSTTGGNFSMLNTGGTNDVIFSWDETYRYSVVASGNVSNATVTSVSTFFNHLWTAHSVTIYGPGTYTIETNCPAGEPGCRLNHSRRICALSQFVNFVSASVGIYLSFGSTTTFPPPAPSHARGRMLFVNTTGASAGLLFRTRFAASTMMLPSR